MTAVTVNPSMREVLGAPRGRRFSRPSHTSEPTPLTREQRLLEEMRGNPRVAYRLEHGVLPHWMRVVEERRDRRNRSLARPGVLEEGTEPAEGGRHRRHRRPLRERFRWSGWRVLSYGAAVAGGSLLGQVFAMPPW
ncbi:hypothetical protein [Nocardiopsis dassonvillei]|uniref:hypothetical protein n=1 Tax=Nocardiopsis dassonvillei TaxID=2014 RepID=UPI00157D30FD|nr:hypothetical protein [Nocardiopsis dassonvillei]